MSATAVSRVGRNLIKSQPRGFKVSVRLEDSSGAGLIPAFTLIGVKADGFGEIAVATVAYNWLGYTTSEVDTSDDAADGDSLIDVRVQCVAKLIGAGLVQGDVGSPVYVTDNQTITTTVGEGTEVFLIVAAANQPGDHPVNGISAEDELVSVIQQIAATGVTVDLTSEFTVTADDTINNTGGTDVDDADLLEVTYRKKTAAFVGYITEFISATEVFVFVPGNLPAGVISI